MKRRLKPWVQHTLEVIAILTTMPLLMLDDFAIPEGLIMIAIMMIISSSSIFALSKYGKY